MTALPTWRETLPPKWKAVPLKAVANLSVSNVDKIVSGDELPVRLCNYTDVYKNESITPDLDFMTGSATREEIEKFGLQVGDVAITKDSESWNDIGVPSFVERTADDLVCGYHLALLRPHKNKLDGRFLFRCLQAKPIRLFLELAANGITRYGIPKDEIGRLPLPLPPLDEQRDIVRFLDSSTKRLDALLAEKSRLIGLLEEKRRTLVTESIIRGINVRARLRDSRIPWLGSIPQHWKVSRLAFLFRDRDERGKPDLPLLEVSINHGVTLRHFSEDKIESTASDFNTYKVARMGDIVFNKMRMWQGAVGLAPVDGLTSPDYTVAEPTGPLGADYASLLFRTPIFSAECARHSNGIVWDRLRLYWEGFRDIWVPLPPPEEQKQIVAHVAFEMGKLNRLLASATRTNGLLKERRSALIASAVMGRLQIL